MKEGFGVSLLLVVIGGIYGGIKYGLLGVLIGMGIMIILIGLFVLFFKYFGRDF
tara:strand:- start:336 stop:497 length:162 start_codon:yes stop_codon:yes gene_type:complete